MSQTSLKRVLFKHTRKAKLLGVFAVFVPFVLITSVMSLISLSRPAPAYAASAKTLNFQARLLNGNGAIVPDGTYNIEFKLYDAATSTGSSQGSCTGDANCMWTETRYDSNGVTAGNDNRVTVKSGYVSVYLGDITDLPSNIWTKQLWLTMNIGGSAQTATPTWDGEMTPRLRLTAVPVAYSLTNYNSVTGYSSSLSLSGATGGDQSFNVPDQGAAGSYTLLTTQAANGAYIQNQSAADQTADFRISGTGRANTALQAPLFDTATAAALAIGTTNATAINLNQNTTVATGKNLTVTAGATILTGAVAGSSTGVTINPGHASNVGLVVKGAVSQTADLVQVQDSTGAVLVKVNNGGSVIIPSSALVIGAASGLGGGLNVQTASAGSVGQVIRASAAQTAELLQVQDSAGNVNASFNAAGNQLTLGRIASSGTVTQGTLVVSDGTTSGFGVTLQSSTLTADRKFLFPDTALATTASPGTICVYNGSSSNCPAATGSSFYLWNSTTVQPSSNFYLRSAATGSVVGVLEGANGQTADLLDLNTYNGTTSTTVAKFTAAGNLQVASSVDVNTATTLTLGGTNATAINLNQDTTVTTGKSLTVTAGATTFTGLVAGSSTALTINAGATNNVGLKVNGGTATSSLQVYRDGGMAYPSLEVDNAGRTFIRPQADTADTFSVSNAATGSQVVAVDTTNSILEARNVHIGAGNLGASPTARLSVDGALQLTGTAQDTFVTPQNSSIGTKINIPLFDPGAFGQLLAFGLDRCTDPTDTSPTCASSSYATSTARAISIFDNRIAGAQPALSVFSPDENSMVGFSWQGDNNTARVMTNSQAGTTDAIMLQSGESSGAAAGTGNVIVSSGQATNASSGPSGNVFISTGDSTGGNSGNILIDTGSAGGTRGTISIGTSHATGITVGNTGVTTTIQGNTGVTLNGTTGTTQVCRNGSGLLSSCDATYLAPTATNFIQNQNASAQSSSNFWISGTGIAATLQAATIDTPSGTTTLAVGTTNATTGINLNQNTVLAASKSLRITGGNTASRPGSPTEGMVYYDTTTHQLLTYNNSKWVSDRTDAIIVAASNSSQADKDAADYVADGNTGAANDGDQVQINAALTAAAGKKVVLLAGTYTADATILIPNNTTLTGVGQGTLIQLADIDATDNLIENSDQAGTATGLVIRDLSLDGNKSANTGAITQNGIYFVGGVGDATTRDGVTLENLWISNFETNGIEFHDSVANSKVIGVVSTDNDANGMYVASDPGSINSTITASRFQNNGNDGLRLAGWYNWTIANNVANNNVGRGFYISSSYTTITGNTANNNTSNGFSIADTLNSTITGNTANGNSFAGIQLTTSNNNTVSGNTLADNSSTADNNGISITTSDSNTITGNTITDSAHSLSNYAITITNAGSDTNYLSDNSLGGGTINDSGTGTVYGGQTLASAGDFLFRGANSATAFRIQNAAGTSTYFNVDSSTNAVTVANATINLNASSNFATNINTGTSTGTTTIGNSSNTNNTVNIAAGTTGGINLQAKTTITGDLIVSNNSASISGTSTGSYKLSVGGTVNASNTGSQYGIQNEVSFTPTGASLSNIWGTSNIPTVAGSSLNIGQVVGTQSGIATTAGYTGQIALASGIQVTAPSIAGSQKILDYRGISVSGNADNGGNTSGTLSNAQLRIGGNTTAAGVGGAVNNYGTYMTLSSGNTAGTNNYGLYITGNGDAGATSNYAIYSNSTAASLLSGAFTTSGGTISLNDNSNFATTINTGSSTGTTTIGNGTSTAGTITLQGGVNSAFTVTNATGTTKLGFAAPSTAGTVTFNLPAGGTGGNTYGICTTLTVCTGYIGSSLQDNITDALDIQEGTNNYINVNTTNGSENISLGNATTNPSVSFLGTGTATFNGNVVLAASKSLTVTGGNTASRPGSPTEGMVYYDTTTHELIKYNGTKWVSDHSAATKIVAASNSSQALKDAADYVATGTGDQATINTALTAAAGGTVYLVEGTYSVNATISIPNNTTLAGAGKSTLIQLADIDATDNLIENSDTATGTGVVIRDLQLDGQQSLQTGSITQNGIALNHMGSQATGRFGARLENLYIKDFHDAGVFLDTSENNTITNTTFYSMDTGGSAPAGVYSDSSSNNSYVGNTFLSNYWGLRLDGSGNHGTAITGNVFRGNSQAAVFNFGAVGTTITSNTFDANVNGVNMYTGGSATVSGNTFYANTGYSVFVDDSSSNTITGNRIQNSGNTTDNNAIYIQNNSDSNTITSNTITDSSATTTNYAIRIASAGSDTNYLSDNSLGGGTINDSGTGTVYGGQIDGSSNLQLRGMTGINIQGTTTVNTSGSAATTIGNSSAGAIAMQSASTIGLTGTTTITGLATGTNNALTVSTNGNANNTGIRINTTGTTTNALEVYSSVVSKVVASFDNAGDLTLGSTTTSGANAAGSLILSDGDTGASVNTLTLRTATGATGNYSMILNPASLTADRTYTLPDLSGTFLLLQGSTPGTQQTGNINMSGTAIIGGNLTAGTAGSNIFTNNGATLNATLALGDLATGNMGASAAATVDVYTSFTISPTASGRSYTILSPTTATAGRIIYVSNINATNSFTLVGNKSVLINPGVTATLIWNGSAWAYAGTDASNLQLAYSNSTGSTTPEILLDSTRNGLDIQDANSTLGSSVPLFAVRGSATASTLGSALFTVTNNANAPLVGIGTNVATRALDVSVSNSTTNALPLLVRQASTGDAGLELRTTTASWYVGADNSDSSAFKISSSVASGNTSVLGNSSIGSTDDTSDNNIVNAGKYVASASGSVTSLSVYIACTISGSPNNQFRMGLYTNSAGTPGTLLVGSSAQTLATGWNTVIVSPTAVTSGTTYWIGYNTNGTLSTNNCFRKSTSGGELFWSTSYSFAAMPGTWPGTAGNDTSNASFYATVENTTANDSFAVQLFNMSTTGAATFQNSTNSTTAFQIQNAAGTSMLTADTTNTNLTLTSASNASTLLNVTNNSATTNTVSAITTNALTTGKALSISSTGTGITSGSLLYVSTATTGAVATNGIVSINASGNYTSTSNAGLLNVAANTTQAGTITNVSGNALTTGVGINVGSTGTGLTTGSLLKISSATTGAVATNGIVAIQATGNYTSTSNIGALTVQANSTTAGTIERIEGNALTTGVGLSIASTGTGLTTGSLLNVTSATTGAVATNGIVSFQATGNYTSTSNVGLLNAVANATTAGTIVNISGTALTTGVALNINANNGTAIKTAGNYQFASGANRTMSVETNTANAAGYNLTISAGAAGSGAAAFTGGTLTLQGGAAGGTGNANGGGISISGGVGTGTGVKGLVVIDTPTFSTASSQNCAGADCTITQANVDSYGAVLVSFSSTGFEAAIPDPNQTTAGRIVYVTAAVGSSDFTLCLNDVAANAAYDGTCNTTAGNSIAMRANTTATLVWNGTDWTAAGASSSTDLQAAYNNTLTSAGGAELVLNAAGGAADGLTVRNNGTTPINGGLLEVQTSIGTNIFSANNLSTELVANGGAENSANFATNWTQLGTSTITRTTTAGQYTTGTAGVSVAAGTTAGNGVRNNLATNPAVSTNYMVSFTAKLGSGSAFTDLRVDYTPTGASTGTSCITGQTLLTTEWTRITCEVATPVTAVTNPDILIYQVAAAGVARTFYIDNLSMTLADDAGGIPNNVQIGGGINGGAPTLFTLDRSSAPPVANGNTTYFGSMYYDTGTGRIQCYEADGWGACGSAPDNIIVLTPEYSNAVLNGTGVGTMTADFCSNQTGVLSVNTGFCSAGLSRNYYKWTSPQASDQTYSIYVSYKLPSTFKEFYDDNTIKLTGYKDHATNGQVTLSVFRSTGSAVSQCGSSTTVTTGTSAWNTTSLGGSGEKTGGCGFAAGDTVIFKIDTMAKSNANVYVENLEFRYTNL